jgi:hypothetical protein
MEKLLLLLGSVFDPDIIHTGKVELGKLMKMVNATR